MQAQTFNFRSGNLNAPAANNFNTASQNVNSKKLPLAQPVTDTLSRGNDFNRNQSSLGLQQCEQRAQTFRPTILQHNKNTFTQYKSVSDLNQSPFGSFSQSFYPPANGLFAQPRPGFNSFSVPSYDGQLCGMFKSNLSLNEKDSI